MLGRWAKATSARGEMCRSRATALAATRSVGRKVCIYGASGRATDRRLDRGTSRAGVSAEGAEISDRIGGFLVVLARLTGIYNRATCAQHGAAT